MVKSLITPENCEQNKWQPKNSKKHKSSSGNYNSFLKAECDKSNENLQNKKIYKIWKKIWFGKTSHVFFMSATTQSIKGTGKMKKSLSKHESRGIECEKDLK